MKNETENADAITLNLVINWYERFHWENNIGANYFLSSKILKKGLIFNICLQTFRLRQHGVN